MTRLRTLATTPRAHACGMAQVSFVVHLQELHLRGRSQEAVFSLMPPSPHLLFITTLCTCVAHSGKHGRNEQCAIKALGNLDLYTVRFETEEDYE